jgi:D-alanyl-D-alanine dipeptidase
MVCVPLYDGLADTYDLMISWTKRLRNEKPFFRQVFKEYKVKRVLDVACGTGMHAVAFHDMGHFVVGADPSPAMVEKARANAGEREIEFIQAGFTELANVNGMFDAVTCLGNSLPHVLDDSELNLSLENMYDALLPGGVLIIHGNNYDRILHRKERFMPLVHRCHGRRDYLFVRFFDFHGDYLTFNVVTMTNASGAWSMTTDSSKHRALTHDLLTSNLVEAGFEVQLVFGGFPDSDYDSMESDNLIVVAQRPHTLWSNPPGEPISAINRIPIRDNGEPMVDIGEAIPGIEIKESPTFARKKVVEMIAKAQASLPKGYRLKIRDACRSLERQTALYHGAYERLKEEHPEWPASQIRRQLNKFLAPPDAKHPPGHSTGGAVDVMLIDPNGEEVDMNSTIKPELTRFAALPTYSKHITPRAAKNRQLLLDVMTGVGFSNYPGEWWHYSYGDSAWAVRVGAEFAPYGAADQC